MPNRRGRTLTNAERAPSSKAASSERCGCMGLYLRNRGGGCGVMHYSRRYDRSRRSHSAPVVRHDSLRKRGELHPLLAKLVDLLHDLFDRSLAVIEGRDSTGPQWL